MIVWWIFISDDLVFCLLSEDTVANQDKKVGLGQTFIKWWNISPLRLCVCHHIYGQVQCKLCFFFSKTLPTVGKAACPPSPWLGKIPNFFLKNWNGRLPSVQGENKIPLNFWIFSTFALSVWCKPGLHCMHSITNIGVMWNSIPAKLFDYNRCKKN